MSASVTTGGAISIISTSRPTDSASTVTSSGDAVGRSEDLFVLKTEFEAGLAEIRDLVAAGLVVKTAQEWQTENPSLQQGTMAYDLTNKRLKIGDGFNSWNDLQFIEEPGLDEIRIEYGNYESFKTHLDNTIT